MTLSGRKVKKTKEIWILTASSIKDYAERLGYAKIIESAGARLVCNTCPVLIPPDYFMENGYNVIAVDSSKLVTYIQNTKDIPCCYGGLATFIDVITNPV